MATTIVAITLAALGGAVLGACWGAFAPRVLAMVSETAISVTEEESGRTFAAEGVFAAITVIAGVVTAVVGWRWMRTSGPLAVVGLAAVGLVGSLVTWRVGVWVGPDPVETLTGLTVGQSVAVPLTLRSRGLLLAWPITTVFLLLWIAALTVESGTAADRADAEVEAQGAAHPAHGDSDASDGASFAASGGASDAPGTGPGERTGVT